MLGIFFYRVLRPAGNLFVISLFVAMQSSLERRSLDQIVAETTIQNGQLGVPCSSVQYVCKSQIKVKEVYEGFFKVAILCSFSYCANTIC